MNINNVLKKSTGKQQPKWLSIFRIALGLILFWRGISFLYNPDELGSMLRIIGIDAQVFSFAITYLNLLGGLFIAVGLFTKWASIVQIPILLGAIFFVNIRNGSTSELALSAIVLILLFAFTIEGSGIISADEYFRNYYKAGKESGHTKKLFS